MWCVPSSTYHSTLHLLGQQERASFLRASVNSKCPVWKKGASVCLGNWREGRTERSWNFQQLFWNHACCRSLARKPNQSQSVCTVLNQWTDIIVTWYHTQPNQSNIEHRTSTMVLYHTVLTILASCHVMSPKAWSEEDQSASSLISSWYEYPIAMILWVESSLDLTWLVILKNQPSSHYTIRVLSTDR